MMSAAQSILRNSGGGATRSVAGFAGGVLVFAGVAAGVVFAGAVLADGCFLSFATVGFSIIGFARYIRHGTNSFVPAKKG